MIAAHACSLFCATLWWVWHARNKEVLNHSELPMELILKQISLEVDAYLLDLFQSFQSLAPCGIVWWELPS